jgi:hypothetical protein
VCVCVCFFFCCCCCVLWFLLSHVLVLRFLSVSLGQRITAVCEMCSLWDRPKTGSRGGERVVCGEGMGGSEKDKESLQQKRKGSPKMSLSPSRQGVQQTSLSGRSPLGIRSRPFGLLPKDIKISADWETAERDGCWGNGGAMW